MFKPIDVFPKGKVIMSLKNKNGNLALEAAIVLPMVILGILTLAYMIKINTLEERCNNIAVDELRLISMESYSQKGKAEALFFPIILESRLKENRPEGTEVSVTNFRYLYRLGKKDNLISFNLNYDIELRFPIRFCDDIEGESYLIGRAFVGNDDYASPNGFTDMELVEESQRVFVFPVSGEKYHDAYCTYIKSSTQKTLLSKEIKKNYKSCSMCDSGTIGEGSIVLYFPGFGEAYHRENCKTIEKHVVEIEKKEALQRGYMPCAKCGG